MWTNTYTLIYCRKSYLTFHDSSTPRYSAVNFCRNSSSENNRWRMSLVKRSNLLRGKSSRFSCAARQPRLNLVFAETMIKRRGGYWIFTRVRPMTFAIDNFAMRSTITCLTARPEPDATDSFPHAFYSSSPPPCFLFSCRQRVTSERHDSLLCPLIP